SLHHFVNPFFIIPHLISALCILVSPSSLFSAEVVDAAPLLLASSITELIVRVGSLASFPISCSVVPLCTIAAICSCISGETSSDDMPSTPTFAGVQGA